MGQFACRVGTPEGRIAERRVSAATSIAAREQLLADGLEVFEVAPVAAAGGRFPLLQKLASIQIGGGATDEGGRSLFGRNRNRVKVRDLLLINQELAALVNAGLPLLRCVDILRTRRSGTVAGSMLDRVRRRLAGGAALSEALQPEIERVELPELFVTSVEVGEASGDLVTAIRRYSDHLGKTQALRSRVRAAMVYPIVLAVVSTVVVGILLTIVIPQFASFYSSSGAELPFATRALVGLAVWARTWGWLIVLVTAGAIGWFLWWKRSPAGRYAIDAFNLRMPVLGAMRRRYYGLETVRTLSTLLRGGAPLVRALGVTAEGTGNRAYRAGIERVAVHVSEGSSLHEAMESENLLDSLGLEMVQVGESTGSLEDMLEHVATTYDEVLDRQVTTAVGLIEPAMLVTMGVLVAAILMSLYLPLFRTVQVVG